MTSLVYFLHLLIVFFVPVLFGWVFLRRIFREGSLSALIPGAVVVGLAALMVVVNELRFFWEMRIAVWFAYKLLLAATLAMIVTRTRPAPFPRWPRCLSRPWAAALLLAATVGVTCYYGIPAFHGYLNDAWWYHYPAAVQIQDLERFPLPHVYALDDPLYYHHGPDILSACWSFLLEIPVQTACALNIAILAPCAFLLAFALLARLSRNYWGSLLGALVLIAGGNLRFLLLLGVKPLDAIGALQALNSQTVQGLLQLIFTPSHALGIPLVLTILLLFRHFSARPSWLLGATLGLLLGSLTLVAEWYFLPLVAGFALVMAWQLWRRRAIGLSCSSARAAIAALPVIVALFLGTFNNTYLAGVFGHFWMHYPRAEETDASRQIAAELNHPGDTSALVRQIIAEQNDPSLLRESGLDHRTVYKPAVSVPNLVPLRLNFAHFGQVPSWESAASNESSFIPVFGLRFFLEAAPVLLCGLPFGLWLAWRRRTPLVLLLAWLAVASAIPPVLLDWGYRSTDFLRFFTASFSFAALFLGWLAGSLLSRATARHRFLGMALAGAALISPIGLGVIGLIPGTLDTVKTVASTAQSLSQVAGQSRVSGPAENEEAVRHRAFEELSVTLGNFLYPLAHGRERAIIIVPPEQVPEVKYFQEWMKMATLSRIPLPVGWHWLDSIYSGYYRTAVTQLDAASIAALDARWVVSSNVFLPRLPDAVATALSDGTRFTPVARFRSGRYTMTVFKVRP